MENLSNYNIKYMTDYFEKEFKGDRARPCKIIFITDDESDRFGLPIGCRVMYYHYDGKPFWHFVDLSTARKI